MAPGVIQFHILHGVFLCCTAQLCTALNRLGHYPKRTAKSRTSQIRYPAWGAIPPVRGMLGPSAFPDIRSLSLLQASSVLNIDFHLCQLLEEYDSSQLTLC